MSNTIRAAKIPNFWLFIRFEQGRGRGGVPKTFIPYLVEGTKTPSIETLTKMAVQMLRAQCTDSTMHGRDLMPGHDNEYYLHGSDGAIIETVEDLVWEPAPNNNGQFCELVLTWKIPNELLLSSL